MNKPQTPGHFTTLRFYAGANNEFFALGWLRHWHRLVSTWPLLFQDNPNLPKREQIEEQLTTTLQDFALTTLSEDCRIRITFTAAEHKIESFAVEPLTPNAAITLHVFEGERPLAHLKTLDKSLSEAASASAKSVGADAALLVNDGMVREAAWSNLGCINGDGVLRLPYDRALPGVLRALVIQLVNSTTWRESVGHVLIDESPLSLAELSAGREVFVCSAVRGVQVVERISDHHQTWFSADQGTTSKPFAHQIANVFSSVASVYEFIPDEVTKFSY